MPYRSPTRPERAPQPGARTAQPRGVRGFVLPAAIFIIVILAALGAFMVHISTAANIASAQDVQGARALQAARAGIETGLYAVRIGGNCPGGTLDNLPGLAGFQVIWRCEAFPFKDGSADGNPNRSLWRITSTACSGAATCPGSGGEVSGSDYVERQLVVMTERAG